MQTEKDLMSRLLLVQLSTARDVALHDGIDRAAQLFGLSRDLVAVIEKTSTEKILETAVAMKRLLPCLRFSLTDDEREWLMQSLSGDEVRFSKSTDLQRIDSVMLSIIQARSVVK